MGEILPCVLFTYVDLTQFYDPLGDIWIQNRTARVRILLCNLSSIIEEAGLEDYSFWIGYSHNNLDSNNILKYLNDNNIRYSSYTDDKDRVTTNPDLMLLEGRLRAEDHRIRFTRDADYFTIYENDRILLNSVWEGIIQYFVSNYIDDTLISIFKSTGKYHHGGNIDIFECDVPLLIRWLRGKYTVKAKSANKI